MKQQNALFRIGILQEGFVVFYSLWCANASIYSDYWHTLDLKTPSLLTASIPEKCVSLELSHWFSWKSRAIVFITLSAGNKLETCSAAAGLNMADCSSSTPARCCVKTVLLVEILVAQRSWTNSKLVRRSYDQYRTLTWGIVTFRTEGWEKQNRVARSSFSKRSYPWQVGSLICLKGTVFGDRRLNRGAWHTYAHRVLRGWGKTSLIAVNLMDSCFICQLRSRFMRWGQRFPALSRQNDGPAVDQRSR